MRVYTKQHRYDCGVDLHARSLYACVLDQAGKTRVHRKMPCDPARFRELLEPFRKDVVVAVECLFCCYWLADLCAEENIPFVLGHACPGSASPPAARRFASWTPAAGGKAGRVSDQGRNPTH